MKRYWISWYSTEEQRPFELHTPWWISGERSDGASTICAAIIADSEEAAEEAILAAHDERPSDLEWRFCEERPSDWSPFCERFPRADWMRWPDAAKEAGRG